MIQKEQVQAMKTKCFCFDQWTTRQYSELAWSFASRHWLSQKTYVKASKTNIQQYKTQPWVIEKHLT